MVTRVLVVSCFCLITITLTDGHDSLDEEILEKRMLDPIGASLLRKRMLDPIGDSLLRKRMLDPIGSGLLKKRMLDPIGNSLLKKRMLDSIGSGLLRKRMLDSIGSGLLKKRMLDPIGQSLLKRDSSSYLSAEDPGYYIRTSDLPSERELQALYEPRRQLDEIHEGFIGRSLEDEERD